MIGNYKTFKEYEKALKNKLKNLIILYNDDDLKFPFKSWVLGFPPLRVNTRYDLKIRIEELSNCLHLKTKEVDKIKLK